MAASLDGSQSCAADFHELHGALVGDAGIVFGMEDHELRWLDLGPVMPRVVEVATAKLVPVTIREPISITERLADVLCIASVGGLDFLRLIQNCQSTTGQLAMARRTRESRDKRIAAAPPKLPPMT